MNHGETTAVFIVAIIMIASIFKTIFGGPRRHRGVLPDDAMASENRQLRSEVQELKERLKVLERITVDKENSLSREIESLRDH